MIAVARTMLQAAFAVALLVPAVTAAQCSFWQRTGNPTMTVSNMPSTLRSGEKPNIRWQYETCCYNPASSLFPVGTNCQADTSGSVRIKLWEDDSFLNLGANKEIDVIASSTPNDKLYTWAAGVPRREERASKYWIEVCKHGGGDCGITDEFTIAPPWFTLTPPTMPPIWDVCGTSTCKTGGFLGWFSACRDPRCKKCPECLPKAPAPPTLPPTPATPEGGSPPILIITKAPATGSTSPKVIAGLCKTDADCTEAGHVCTKQESEQVAAVKVALAAAGCGSNAHVHGTNGTRTNGTRMRMRRAGHADVCPALFAQLAAAEAAAELPGRCVPAATTVTATPTLMASCPRLTTSTKDGGCRACTDNDRSAHLKDGVTPKYPECFAASCPRLTTTVKTGGCRACTDNDRDAHMKDGVTKKYPECFAASSGDPLFMDTGSYNTGVSTTWFGTAPLCSTDESDCTSRGMKFVKFDKDGDGKRCLVGQKVLCVKTLSITQAPATGSTSPKECKDASDAEIRAQFAVPVESEDNICEALGLIHACDHPALGEIVKSVCPRTCKMCGCAV